MRKDRGKLDLKWSFQELSEYNKWPEKTQFTHAAAGGMAFAIVC